MAHKCAKIFSGDQMYQISEIQQWHGWLPKILWESPTVKRALPKQRLPWQLQRPLVCAPPSNKIWRCGPPTRQHESQLFLHQESTATASLLVTAPAADYTSDRQRSSGQPASPSLAQASSCGRSFASQPTSLSLALVSLLLQELLPASRRHASSQSPSCHKEDCLC
jgi:hypothetical protein